MQLPYTHQFQFAGLYAAIKQGYFAERGLEVELRTGTAARRPTTEVQEGRAQYGIGATGVLLDRLNGSPFVALATIFQHSPFVLMTRADRGLTTPASLVGKRIAMSPTGRYTEIRAMLYAEGVRPDQIREVPDVWNRNELLTDEADAISSYLTDGPFAAEQEGLRCTLIRPVDYGVDFYGDLLFTTEDEVRLHPDRARAMRQAVLRGWEYALARPEEMIEWILTRLPVEDRSPGRTREWLRFEAAATSRLINADLVELGHMNFARWRRMAELVVAVGQARSTDRLRGFVFESGAEPVPAWALWLFGGLGVAVVAVAGSLFAYSRLQALVRRRTEELAVSEQRQREYFQLAPAPIVIEDYRAVLPVLDRLRAAGVTDLRAHLRDHPDVLRELVRAKRVVAANRQALVRLGFRTVDELNAQVDSILTNQAIDITAEEMHAIWAGEDHLTLEKSYQSIAGEPIHTLLRWEIGTKDGQRDLANVRLVFNDITQQKQAELALRKSEERYRQLVENAVGGVYRSSPSGEFLTVNPALARMFGFARPDEMFAWARERPEGALYVQPGRRAEFVEAVRRDGEVHDFESEVRVNGGGTRWVSEDARAVYDAAGQLLHYEGFVTDITVRRQLESEIARASKLEAVGILAGGIAHDFNNILTVVLGNITLIEADLPAGSALAGRLGDARKATLRARDLTMQLLTFAKGGEPVKSHIELPDILREYAGFALHGAKARGEFHLPRGLWPVNADKGQLGQVVQNLVINAVQAMPEGGVVTISAENVTLDPGHADAAPLPPGRYVHLAVADNGTGIAREHLAKIFDPYFTTKQQGSGLGLATAYSVIRKHEGHIAVESELGKGTTFRLWLPAGPVSAPAAAAAPGGSRSPFRPRVLFMDDEEAIRTMALLFMDRLGYQCDVAADGAEAVRKYGDALAAGRRYEVVVMDLTVPGGMGGREAMERLRRLDPGVCAVVSSGYSRDPVLASYRDHGFQAILPKPYGLEQLTKVMNEVLDHPVNPS